MTKKEWTSYIYNHLQKIDETNKYHPVVIEKTIDTVYSQLFSEAYIRDPKGMWQYVRDYSETITETTDFSVGSAISNEAVSLPRINGGMFKFKFIRWMEEAFANVGTVGGNAYIIGEFHSDLAAGDEVTISGSSVYNGTHEILTNLYPAGVVLDTAYISDDAGTIYREYNEEEYYPCDLTGRDMYNHNVDSTYDTIGVQGRYLVTFSGGKIFIPFSLGNDSVIAYSIIPKFSTLSATDEVILPIGAEEVMADRVLDTMRLIPPVDLINDNADSYGRTQ